MRTPCNKLRRPSVVVRVPVTCWVKKAPAFAWEELGAPPWCCRSCENPGIWTAAGTSNPTAVSPVKGRLTAVVAFGDP